jgi:hypothetical protein
MEHFVTLCRESAAAADDPEHATELIAMANAIALGMQARAVPPIKPRIHGNPAFATWNRRAAKEGWGPEKAPAPRLALMPLLGSKHATKLKGWIRNAQPRSPLRA